MGKSLLSSLQFLTYGLQKARKQAINALVRGGAKGPADRIS